MGVPVKEGAEVPEGYEVRKVEGILAAQTVYEGALGDMNKIKAYDALRKWIQENDAYVYDWTQPAIEIYLDSALKEGKKGRTRILFPIRKK
jgi:effector-binding domain-containing protein